MRSCFPKFSMCGYGKHAEEILNKHKNSLYQFDENSPYSIATKEYNAKVLLMGMGKRPHKITVFHCASYALTSMITPFVLRFFDIKWQIWINGITTIMYIIISLSLLKLGGLMGFCIGALLANIIKLLITTYVYLKKTSRSSE